MAVILRWDGIKWTALCAAEYSSQNGDVYLDDSQDHALRIKYIEDYKEEGLILRG